jgi:bacterioferritin-associated ferredoxin
LPRDAPVIVCSCNCLTEAQVRESCTRAEGAARSTFEVYKCLGCSPKCGTCARTIRKIMDETLGRGACNACPVAADAACGAARIADALTAVMEPLPPGAALAPAE